MHPWAQQIELKAREGIADALNQIAVEVYHRSQIEVPKSGEAADVNRHGETLAESGRYPLNDPTCAATPYPRQGRDKLGRFVKFSQTTQKGETTHLPASGVLEETVQVTESEHDVLLEDFILAEVVYDHPAAAAQHEGEMIYERNGKEVFWQVENYTTAGTKKHYLSDPVKALSIKVEATIGTHVATKLATARFGPVK